MQRWMLAKEQLARSHGRVKSGAGRAMGWVSEDRIISSTTPAPLAVKGHVACRSKPCLLAAPRDDTTVSACDAHRAARRAFLKLGNRR